MNVHTAPVWGSGRFCLFKRYYFHFRPGWLQSYKPPRGRGFTFARFAVLITDNKQ